MPQDLFSLVAASYSSEEAAALRDVALSDADFAALERGVREILSVFKPVPGACILLSALLVFRLESLATVPAYAVAGTLAIGDKFIFGSDTEVVDRRAFSQSNASWDGHGWVQFGNFIVDVSLCQTAYSAKSHPILASHIRARYGEGRGALICTDAAMRNDGLNYTPQYVLTRKELDPLINGGLKMLEEIGRGEKR